MKLTRILLNSDGADSSGAHSVFEGDADPGDTGQQQGAGEGEGASGGEEAGGEEQQTQQEQAPSASLTPEEIARIAAGVVQQSGQQTTQQQRQLTPEEFDKTFHMARVKSDVYNKLRLLFSTDTPEAHAEGAQLLESLLQAAAKQAVVMGGYQQADLEDRIMQRLDPVMKLVQQQQTEALKAEFYNAHKDLMPWQPVVEAVTQKLQAAGAFKALNGDKAKSFKLVSDEVRKVIQGLPGGKSGATNGAAGQQQQQSRTSRMSSLTSGGQGGTQRGGGTPPKKSAGHAVFS